MSNPILGELSQTVSDTIGVMKSATALINGFAARLKQAIADAIANGATEEEIKPLADLETALEAEEGSLAQAVADNS